MRKFRRLFVFVLILSLFWGMSACSMPFSKPEEGIWYCEELMIEIDFTNLNTHNSPNCGKKYNPDGTYENVLVYFSHWRGIYVKSENQQEYYLNADYLYLKDAFYVTTNEEKITYVFKRVDKPS